MAVHEVPLERRTLHGHFSRELAPVLLVEPGDTVVMRTLDANWNLAPPATGETARVFSPRHPGLDDGHALCGPIAVRGARPGGVLAIDIGEVRTGTWGWTGAGGFPGSPNRLYGVDDEPRILLNWDLDRASSIGRDQFGHVVALAPFMGVMGMPPSDFGVHPTRPPRRTGGNLDCRELVSGSRLLLPIEVAGGLFSAGDGHAAQGDGEVSGTGIECPMDRVELTLSLADGMSLSSPAAETPAGWLTFGVDADLEAAHVQALNGMLDLLCQRLDCTRKEAIGLASVAVHIRITQVVNGVKGVHALLPAGAVSR